MGTELWIAFAQAFRWVIAGIAGAAFSKYDILDKNFWYLVGLLVPLILTLAVIEYLIQVLIIAPT